MNLPKIVVLTGAGISAESGIKTFRDQNGLWENHSIEEVATYEAYIKNPELVHQFYNARREQLLSDQVKPNPAHHALKKLYDALGDDHFFLVTQNIDDLHDRVDTPCVHMHGELLKVRCENCSEIYEHHAHLYVETPCSQCAQPGQLRPHVVWFGEIPLQMDYIYDQLATADIFLSIGTSGLVYPAAQFVQEAKRVGGAKCIELNREHTPRSIDFDQSIQGLAGDTVPQWVDQFIQEQGI
ncbi:MAG: NAD-dependent deacylase [Bdellovibrionales bacterium]